MAMTDIEYLDAEYRRRSAEAEVARERWQGVTGYEFLPLLAEWQRAVGARNVAHQRRMAFLRTYGHRSVGILSSEFDFPTT